MKTFTITTAIAMACIFASTGAFAKGNEDNPVYIEGGTVSVDNFPESLTVDGTVSVGGAVSVNNFPSTQTVNGIVNVGNLPATQNVAGTVSVGNLPATQDVNVTSAVPLDVFVTNSDAPDMTYHFAGVTTERIQARMVYMQGHEHCQADFGAGAKVTSAREIRDAIRDGILTSGSVGSYIQDWGSGSADGIGKAYFTPDDGVGLHMFWINSYGRIFEKEIGENNDLFYTACSVPDA